MGLREVLSGTRAAPGPLFSGTFEQYLEIVRGRPSVADLAHARVDRVLRAASGDGRPNGFFSGELFGLEKPAAELATYFAAASRRLDTRRRVVLLVGPVGGGKSTMVSLLKRGLEAYSRTDAGAVYAIAGCPMHEEPLHLVPQELREAFSQEMGVEIEGTLCPVCDQRFGHLREGLMDVPVERILFSEHRRVGIGTFLPSDPKSQDMAELTGSMDLATVGTYGAESDPRAFRFDGELNVASRGLMEFIELLKADERFLYVLLTLCAEQSIKTPRFPLIYADEVVVAHTNEAEYRAFCANPKNEALLDRMVVVKVPYTLRVSQEVRVYRKLLGQGDLGRLHIAPHTLEVCAMFSVLTRLKESRRNGLTRLGKMKLYDGEDADGFPADQAEALASEQEEGMAGVSPRVIIDCLAAAAVEAESCLGPVEALGAIEAGLSRHPGIEGSGKSWSELQLQVREAWRDMAARDVGKALCPETQDPVQDAFWTYAEALRADAAGGSPPEDALARAHPVEKRLGVGEGEHRAFRREMLVRLRALERRGRQLDPHGHAGLCEALSAVWLSPPGDQVGEARALKALAGLGYCPLCARQALSEASTREADGLWD